MNSRDRKPLPAVERIFHPSDFTRASEIAFAHALKIALIARAQLTMLHVSPQGKRDWSDFPGVRQVLEQWGELPPGSSRQAVSRLGVHIQKVIARDDDPVRAAVDYLERRPADLIVLATGQYKGRTRWLNKSVAAPIARHSETMTLFIPSGVDGFVDRASGALSLRNILVPVDREPAPQAAVTAASRAAMALGVTQPSINLLHVGPDGSMPAVNVYDEENWNWNRISREGPVVDAIQKTASDCRADLIVMTTAGRDGFLDALRGSTTERVLRITPCPLLAIPA